MWISNTILKMQGKTSNLEVLHDVTFAIYRACFTVCYIKSLGTSSGLDMRGN